MPVSQTRRRELLVEVFGGLEPALRLACAGWLDASPRLAEFVERHRDKLRKKLKVAEGAEGRRDVLAELHVARCLLADRRLDLEYEPNAAGGGRAPDFVAVFRVNTRFAVEVARLRAGEAEALPVRLVGVTVGKLAQCQPSIPNVVTVVSDDPVVADAIETAGGRLLALANGAEPEYVARRGFRDHADFRRALQRLSAVWLPGGLLDAAPPSRRLWLYPRSRHPLPSALAATLLA